MNRLVSIFVVRLQQNQVFSWQGPDSRMECYTTFSIQEMSDLYLYMKKYKSLPSVWGADRKKYLKEDGLALHSLPSDDKRRQRWIHLCMRDDE